MSNRRSKIIKQLQERIIKIDEEIDKIVQERYLHTCTIKELSKKSYKEENNDSDSEEEVSGSDLSIEIITPADRLGAIKSEKKSRKTKTKTQERQEERDKARAWALDRARKKGYRKHAPL
jgi:hypothetical protein